MPEGARKLATWDDLARIPEGKRAEVIRGEVSFSPSPLPRHGRIQGALSGFVGLPFDYDPRGPGGWWIVVEVDVELSRHDVVRPDVAGWRRERVPRFPVERPVRIAPDWVCEIVSPGSVRIDRITKPALYLASGVGHLWLVDPGDRIVEAFVARDGAWVLSGTYDAEDTAARVPPFEAIELHVGLLFPPADEPAPG